MKDPQERISRREFFSTSGRSLAALAGLKAAGKLRGRDVSDLEGQSAGKNIILRPLGKTGVQLPIVSMGVMNAFLPELVKLSYERGVRYFDTAAYYQRGQNEVMIGKALKEVNARDKTVIGTKVFIPFEQRPKLSPQDAKRIYSETAEGSLKRLQTDYIDILSIHNVIEPDDILNPGIQEAMLELRSQKKVRFFGFSTHINMAACVQKAIELGFYNVVITAFNYAMADDLPFLKMLHQAGASGIGLVAMKTQCTQVDYRESVPAEKLHLFRGKVMQTAVLKWVLRHDFIATAIPGYTNNQQMEEDLSVASGLAFTREEKKFIEDKGVKLALQNYCLQCSRCVLTCPKGADIPTLMRTHLYAVHYGNFFEATAALRNIPRERGLNACASCEACAARCARQVPVGRRINELKAIFA